MKATQQLQAARNLGMKAFDKGFKCTPYSDSELMNLLSGRKIGQTPKGEANSVNIMKAWTAGWTTKNLTNA